MKKNDKIIILLVIILAFSLLTWIVPTGTYQEGVFVSNGLSRVGLFDIFLLIAQTFYVKATDVLYLFFIGGFYGVASRTKGYRKLVSKTSALIKGKEHIAMLVTTLLLGAYTSITNDIYALLYVTPFIITVFLRRGCDRLTALSAAFGGFFIGLIGQTFGTFAYSYLMQITNVAVTEGIVYKILLFIFAYVLYNAFAISYMNKHIKNVEYVRFDVFPITKLDETKLSKSLRKKVWPTILLLSLGLIVILLAFIGWNDSFKVTMFDTALEKINGYELLGTTLFRNILGNFTAFGQWDVMGVSFILLITTLIMGLADKLSINNIFAYFGNGMKKMSKVVVIFVLVNSLFLAYYYFTWPLSFANAFFGAKSFNLIGSFFGSIVNGFFAVDFEYASFMLDGLISNVYIGNFVDAALTIRFAYSIVALIAPTSVILMIGLSYLDIPYTKWLKYIWKFALCITAIGLVGLFIVTGV